MKAKNWSQQNDEQKAALGGYPTKRAADASRGAGQPSDGDGRPGRKPDESGQPAEQRVAQRITRPGEAGLANENRPGLGTRGDLVTIESESEKSGQSGGAAGGKTDTQRAAARQATKDSRPSPREQDSESLEQEQQRSTGMSGQSGGV